MIVKTNKKYHYSNTNLPIIAAGRITTVDDIQNLVSQALNYSILNYTYANKTI